MPTINAWDSANPAEVAKGGTGAATLTGVLTGNGTSAVTATAITQYNVLTAGASNAPNSVAPSGTSGVALISQGSSAQPIFGTVTVPGGGTGAVTLTGVLIGNGASAVTASTVTQYDILVGGASNTISSVGTGSAGQVLQSGGNGANPAYSTATFPTTATGTGTLLRADGTNWSATTSTYPNTNAVSTLLYASSANVMSALATANNGVLKTDGSGVPSIGTAPIAAGGTNATSFTQSAGIVVYNGTSLVNYAGPQISSAGVATNTAQPAFHAYVNGNVASVTGDSTIYTIVYNSTLFDLASNFTTGSGTFTAPVTGHYQFNITVSLYSLTASFTTAVLSLVTTGGTYVLSSISPGKSFETQTGSAEFCLSGSTFVAMTATNTATVTITVSGSTKSVGVIGGANIQNKFSGFLVC